MKTQRIVLYILVITAICVFGFLLLKHYVSPKPFVSGEVRQITVADVTYRVLIAETAAERILGLSGLTTPLPHNADGMLFIFNHPSYHGIWMNDMLIPIDIYWLDNNFKIIHQLSNISPDTYPTVFNPPEPAWYVLEIPHTE